MRYERQGPFSIPGQKFAIVASVLNTLEDFLVLFPVEKPYQRYGPFVNDGPPPFTARFFNGIEDCLSQIQAKKPYQTWGPYVNESGPPVWRILDHIEDFLVTLDIEAALYEQDWQAFYQVGSPMPYGWYERHSGEFKANPDYIPPPGPAGRAEPAQYEQALVDYEQITKDEQ